MMSMDYKMPFQIFPEGLMRYLSFRFLGVGRVLEKTLITTSKEIEQTEIPLNPKDYFSRAIVICIFWFIATFIVFMILGSIGKFDFIKPFFLSLTFSIVMGFLIFIFLIMQPKILIQRKINEIERNWNYALRAMLIQIKSGLTLFDSLVVITEGNFGIVSREMRKTVDKINAGKIEAEALEELAERNPSLFFRRSIWQIIQGLNSGTDVEKVLQEVVSAMTAEEKMQIRKYGSTLGLFTLFYVMIGVIIPALGITFLIVLSNFPQIKITEFVFYGLLAVIVFFQFVYMGTMKTIRPGIMVDA